MLRKKSYKEALIFGESFLKDLNIISLKLDVRLILSKILNKSQIKIICDKQNYLGSKKKKKFLKSIYQRKAGKPVSRILGEREFFSRSFFIDKNTLDPRSDSECLVEAVLKKVNERKFKKINILDIGTGSGCLIISLLLELNKNKNLEVKGTGVDFSKEALKISKRNMNKFFLQNKLTLLHSNWFDKIKDKFDIIITNPPYIESSKINELSNEVKLFDPLISIDGGIDGLKCYKEIAQKIYFFLKPNGLFITEIGSKQKNQVKNIFVEKKLKFVSISKDLSNNDRCLVFSR